MPRVIPDLNAKIINAAGSLFIEKGYSEICMKDVARLVGTSVGNLYNYYPSKKDLFLAGRSIWIKRFRNEYQRLVGSNQDPRSQLEILLTQLMEGLEAWGGLWEEFLASATRELKPEEIRDLLSALRDESRSIIIEPLDALLHQVCGGNSRLQSLLAAPGKRFATSLLSTIKMMIRLYPNQKTANREFILAMIDFKTDPTPKEE